MSENSKYSKLGHGLTSSSEMLSWVSGLFHVTAMALITLCGITVMIAGIIAGYLFCSLVALLEHLFPVINSLVAVIIVLACISLIAYLTACVRQRNKIKSVLPLKHGYLFQSDSLLLLSLLVDRRVVVEKEKESVKSKIEKVNSIIECDKLMQKLDMARANIIAIDHAIKIVNSHELSVEDINLINSLLLPTKLNK